MKSLIPSTFFSAAGEETQSQFEKTATALGLQTLAGKEALRLSLERIKLLDNKQLDYGSRNISGFGTFGILVRMNDKFERIKNLFGKGRRKRATNESIIDSFRDVGNYSLIAEMVETGVWPTE